jgi:hypothetical protein
VKNRFQNVPFERNVQRYTAAARAEAAAAVSVAEALAAKAGLCTLHHVDP